jgi:hypothetical protein
MKKLLVILLIALATCAAIEESFDDDVVLEKSLIKKGKDKLKDTVKKGKDKLKDTINKEKDKIKDKIKHETDKVKEVVTHPGRVIKKTVKEIANHPFKGLNGLFKGKLGVAFRKLSTIVKKGIAWLKENNLWNPLVQQLKSLGQKYGNEFCEKYLPPEICGKAVDFVLDHVIKEEGN